MKRGISRQVSIQRSITYVYTRADLVRLLKLPADAVLEVDGESLDDDTLVMKAHVKENVKTRAAKEAT
jgi:hypothetical protein